MQFQSVSDRSLDDYASVTDHDRMRRIRSAADRLAGLRVLHVNSTATGGGVAELLSSLVPVFDDAGVDTDWGVMDASTEFFEVTKSLHNGLQGRRSPLTDEMKATYRSVTDRNANAISDEYDIVVLHDPQSLGMIDTLVDRFPDTRFVWRCHIDLTAPTESHLDFVVDDVRRTDHVVFSHDEYGRGIDLPPSTVIYPSIDPLAAKNRSLDRSELRAERDRLESISFDADTPVITQVSRFDPWKGQLGALEAYRRLATTFPDLQLVFVGGMAADDPEGPRIFDRVATRAADDPDVHLLTNQPDTTVNFLQRRSDVVLQKSRREGFGLIVSEALWKRTPVVGSNVGGIPLQIDDGESGYLVEPDDVDALAARTERLLADEALSTAFGHHGRATVRDRFLVTRHLLEWLELFLAIR
ncbi:glycosyltransferase [Halobacteria archaeon AArc-m2/3/4]|uniref:Glycosyltransferase n=1 Tax=Natronoglomus mannanivorans TaxID=2979990 RepID=A0ABT2QLL1_9EURY|nr:glycosyltransferase [Halobacteria archaeon AArc-m2/3/4]